MNLATLLGRRIRELRKTRKLSQSELAEATGLSDNFIALLEQGKRSPSLETLEKIASALKAPYDELFLFPSGDKRKLAEKRLLETVKGKSQKFIDFVAELAEVVARHF